MILLASGSPRRRTLLREAGLDFTVLPSQIEERPPKVGEDPSSYAMELARAKAADVAARLGGVPVLAADTVVAVDTVILGKPADELEAVRMLRLLRGKIHAVVTAVVVRCNNEEHTGVRSAQVHMRMATDEELAAYVATGEPMDKAGSYAVQGGGGDLVTAVDGCYNAVVGLPLCLSFDLLQDCGLSLPRRCHLCCER